MAWNPNTPRYEIRKGLFGRQKAWAFAKAGAVAPSTNAGQKQKGSQGAYGGSDRVKYGLVSEWWFDEGEGTAVKDRAVGTTQTNLIILSGTEWIQDATQGNRYALSSNDGYIRGLSGELMDKIAGKEGKQGLTMEAWIKPDNVTMEGPARIMSFSDPTDPGYVRNFMLGQGAWGSKPDDQYRMRVRIDEEQEDGRRLGTTTGATTDLQHVVATVEPNDAAQHTTFTMYIDGVAVAEENFPYFGDTSETNLFSGWDSSFAFILGNETMPSIADRPWSGVFYLVALYNRALEPGEVAQNFAEGVVAGAVTQVPKVGFKDASSLAYADGTRHSVDFVISGKRNKVTKVGYTASSAEGIDFEITTNEPLKVGKNNYSKTIRVQVSGAEDNPENGTIDLTLTSVSTGIIDSGARTHQITVSSLVLPMPEISTPLATEEVVFDNTTTQFQVPLTLNKKHAFEVSAMISGTATGPYGLVDLDGNVSALPETVMVKIPKNTLTAPVTFALSSASEEFTEGDTVTLSILGASGYAGSALTLGTPSSCVVTMTEGDTWEGRPTSGTTGPRAGVTRSAWPHGQVFIDADHPKVNTTEFYGVPEAGLVVSGYNFTGVVDVMTDRPIRFIDCDFDGSGTNLAPVYMSSKRFVGESYELSGGAAEAVFDYCSFHDGDAVFRGGFKRMYRCSFNRAYENDLHKVSFNYDHVGVVDACWYGPHLSMSGLYEGSPKADPIQVEHNPKGCKWKDCAFDMATQDWADGTDNPDAETEHNSIPDKIVHLSLGASVPADQGPFTFENCWFTGGGEYMFTGKSKAGQPTYPGVWEFNSCKWDVQARAGIMDTEMSVTTDGKNVWMETGTKMLKAPDNIVYNIEDVLKGTQSLSLGNLQGQGLETFPKRSIICDDDANCPPMAFDFYVDGDIGDDSNEGSYTAPWKTVDRALSATGRIGFFGGTYDAIYETAHSRTASLKFGTVEGATVSIPGLTFQYDSLTDADFTIEGFDITSTGTIVCRLDKAQNVTIKDCHVHASKWAVGGKGRYGAYISDSADITIHGCNIHEVQRGMTITGSSGTVVKGNRVVTKDGTPIQYVGGNSNGHIEGNHLTAEPWVEDGDHVIGAHHSMISLRSGDITIKRNHINGAGLIGSSYGIATYEPDAAGGESSYDDILIEGNMIYNCVTTTVVRFANLGTNVTLRNNLVGCRPRFKSDAGCADGLEKVAWKRYATAFLVSSQAAADQSGLHLHNNIFMGTVNGTNWDFIDESNNYTWGWKDMNGDYTTNTPSMTSVALAIDSMNGCGEHPTNFEDGTFFKDGVDIIDLYNDNLSQEWVLATGSAGLNFGNVSEQTSYSLGTLGADGFLQDNGLPRSASAHDVGPKQQ